MHLKDKFSLQSFKAGGFAKNIMMISGGAAFAQVLNVLLSPVITRLYSPEQYGVLTLYVSILGLINLLGALSYESAIPIAEDDDKAFNVLMLCMMILISLTTLLILAVMLTGNAFLGIFNAEVIVQYKYFIPAGFLLTGLYTVLSQWALRKKLFKSIATTKYSQTIAGNGTKITLGLANFGAIGLILGNILSQSAGIFTLIKPNLTQFKTLITEVNLTKIKNLAVRYINFPLYTAPGLLILSAAGQLPIIFMASLYDNAVVGLYGLAMGITFLPMTIVGKSVQDVFYGETASIGRSDPQRIKELSRKLVTRSILLAIIPMALLVIFAPMAAGIVFGAEWREAGVFARIIAIEVFFHFVFHPLTAIFTIFEQQKRSLLFYLFKLIVVLGIFMFARIMGFHPYVTVLIYSSGMALLEVIKYGIVQRIINEAIAQDAST